MVVVRALIPVVVSLDEILGGVFLRVTAKGVRGVVACLVNPYLKSRKSRKGRKGTVHVVACTCSER